MSETFLTAEGAAKLKAELRELTTVKRTELAARLRDAIKMGDLSENADYIMAKEDQAFLEGHIQDLEALLRTAKIIDNHDLTFLVISKINLFAFVSLQSIFCDERIITLLEINK